MKAGSPSAGRRADGAPALYGDDLARIQHEGFGDFALRAAPGLLRLLRDAGIRGGVVVDLGCGNGVWLRELGRAGFEAVGVDGSRALVEIARRVAPRAKLRATSLYGFTLPACDAVTAIGEVLGYRPPDGRRGPPLARLFERVAAALRPGGLFVFDLFVAGRGAPMAYRTWRAGDSWAVLVDVHEEPARARLVREITTFRRVGAGYRRSRERHVLDVASRPEVEASLRRAGFSVRTARRYGRCELPPRRLAFLARRR
jgi:SAM-dependent methyltransferase